MGLGKGEVVLHFLNLATSGIEPDLIAHEAIVTTITPYRFGTLYLINTNKETRTLKGLFPLLLKRRLFTNFNMFVVSNPPCPYPPQGPYLLKLGALLAMLSVRGCSGEEQNGLYFYFRRQEELYL